MQHALSGGFGSDVTSAPAKAPSRFNKYLVGGAAVVCAGAIAVQPVAQTTSLTAVQHQAVQLAAWTNPVLENPLALWGKTFSDSFTQVGAIGTALQANPFPILNQIGENQLGYLKVLLGAKAAEGQRRGTGIIGTAEAVGKSITNLPVRLQAINDFLKTGQFTEALVEINTWALVLGENLFFPLLPALKIPGDMFDAVGRVYDSLITRGNINTILKGVMAPALSVAFALSNVVDQVVRSVQAGKIEEAFTAVLNAPAIAVGAFFNGYKPMFGYDAAGEPILSREFFPGIFSTGGPIDALFVKLPKTIAEALAPPVVPTTPAVPPAPAPTLLTLDVSPVAAAAIAPLPTERSSVAAVSVEAEPVVENTPAVETVVETVTETVSAPVTEAETETQAPGADVEAPKAPKKSSINRTIGDRIAKKADAGDSTPESAADKPAKKESTKKVSDTSDAAPTSDSGSESDSE